MSIHRNVSTEQRPSPASGPRLRVESRPTDWRQKPFLLNGEETPEGMLVSYGVLDEITVSLGARALYILLQGCADFEGMTALLGAEERADSGRAEQVAIYLEELFSAGWLITPQEIEQREAFVKAQQARRSGQIPVDLLYATLSDRSKVLYAMVDHASTDLGYAEVTRQDLATWLACSIATIDRTLRELEHAGWLVVNRHKDADTGGGLPSRYFPQPQPAPVVGSGTA